jgi:competence protein ComEA
MDINGAIIEDLQSLPGVGPALARRIIEGRPYRSVEELLRIKGLGRTFLDKMAPFLTAGHATP